MVSTESEQWTPGPIGFDVYGGSPGVALALAGLARETGDDRYRHAALRVVEPFEEMIRSGTMRAAKTSPGGMSGLGGTIYAIATAKRLLGVPGSMSTGELAAELAATVARTAQRSPANPIELEFVAGLAGALAVCLSLHRNAVGDADRAAAEAAARAVAQAMLTALAGADALGYRITPYTGYAHGAMGIGPVLVEYGATFGDPAARDLGLRIVAAVLGAYDVRDRDWPGKWEGAQPRSYGWCHGAPGVLLGCLTAVRHEPSSVPMETLRRLAELTVQRGFGHNPSYCHGDLGSAEIVALADREVPGLFEAGTATMLYQRLFGEVVERYDERADSRFAYSNSLMVGKAGFLWSILRCLDPDAYPSILRFD
jgi:lantibiotic modifying enzyme